MGRGILTCDNRRLLRDDPGIHSTIGETPQHEIAGTKKAPNGSFFTKERNAVYYLYKVNPQRFGQHQETLVDYS